MIDVVDLSAKAYPSAWLWPTSAGYSWELRRGGKRTVGSAKSKLEGLIALQRVSWKVYQCDDVFLQLRAPGVHRA